MSEVTGVGGCDDVLWSSKGSTPQCDYEWELIEESLPLAQWQWGKEGLHGWPYPI